MTDTPEKFMDVARETLMQAITAWRAKSAEHGIRIIARALSKAHQDGIREGKMQAAEIVRSEEELTGEPPKEWFDMIAVVGPVENARAAVRATKKSIVSRILSTITDESE